MIVRRPRAFTLIEMLVVISIIALLIAILLPALFRARDSVEEMTCLNNMSQLMKAEASFAVDHDGYYPHYFEWIWGKSELPPDLPSWYTGTNFTVPANDYTSTLSPEFGVINPYVSTIDVHLCPSAGEMPINALKSGTAPMGDQVVRSYVQNSNVYPEGKYATVEMPNLPSELVILTEENTFIMNFTKGWQHPMNDGKLDLAWDSIGSMHRRSDHENLRSGYASAAFADGHVDWAFSQSQENGNWATVAFADDTLDNPEKQDQSMIDKSMDFSFTY